MQSYHVMKSLFKSVFFQGAQLYYVDSEGTRTPGKVFSVGSGSVYAFGVLDSGYSWDLTDLEAQGKLLSQCLIIR